MKESQKENIIVVVRYTLIFLLFPNSFLTYKYHNQRCRPENERESASSTSRNIIKIFNEETLVFDPLDSALSRFGAMSLGKRNKNCIYSFDQVFDQFATQNQVYEKSAKQLLPHVLNGYNGSVFAYGATGAGKTHTMIGNCTSGPGVMVLALRDLYSRIETLKTDNIFRVSISYLEVYNEQIRDLLSPSLDNSSGGNEDDFDSDSKKKSLSLDVCEEENGKITVRGLTWYTPDTADELFQLLEKGNSYRARSPTDANALSSRSHAVLQIVIESKPKTCTENVGWKIGKLSLIDLAGSERASVSRNNGERKIEGANINKSLLALGNCINALCEGKKNHIPYRDSKLTRILKDSLGGNCKTVMIANISTSSTAYEDTHNTLKYADRAKNIKTAFNCNITSSSSQDNHEIQQLRQQINQLQIQLKTTKSNQQNPLPDDEIQLAFREYKQKITKIYNKLTSLKNELHNYNKTEKQLILRLNKTQRQSTEQRQLGLDVSELQYQIAEIEQQVSTIHQQQKNCVKKLENSTAVASKLAAEIDQSNIFDDNYLEFLQQQILYHKTLLEKIDLVDQNQTKETDLQIQIEKVKRLESSVKKLQSQLKESSSSAAVDKFASTFSSEAQTSTSTAGSRPKGQHSNIQPIIPTHGRQSHSKPFLTSAKPESTNLRRGFSFVSPPKSTTLKLQRPALYDVKGHRARASTRADVLESKSKFVANHIVSPPRRVLITKKRNKFVQNHAPTKAETVNDESLSLQFSAIKQSLNEYQKTVNNRNPRASFSLLGSRADAIKKSNQLLFPKTQNSLLAPSSKENVPPC